MKTPFEILCERRDCFQRHLDAFKRAPQSIFRMTASGRQDITQNCIALEEAHIAELDRLIAEAERSA
jgi:hypothetical protein